MHLQVLNRKVLNLHGASERVTMSIDRGPGRRLLHVQDGICNDYVVSILHCDLGLLSRDLLVEVLRPRQL